MTVPEHLAAMVEGNPQLYACILDTEEFAYHFNEILKAATEFDQVRDALAGVMQLIDDGVLVRDTLQDHRADWAIRQLPLIEALKKAQEALVPNQ